MFRIVQSNNIDNLVKALSMSYVADGASRAMFEPFVVIVPALVLDVWLKKAIARHTGISVLVSPQFWGQYQWQMIARVLTADKAYLTRAGRQNEALSVPEVALLSQSVVRWRLFAYLLEPVFDAAKANQPIQHRGDGQARWQVILTEEAHPLFVLLSPLAEQQAMGQSTSQTLWQLCDTIARLFVQYLTERVDWLDSWAKGGRVDVRALIAKKDALSQKSSTPEPSVLQQVSNVATTLSEQDEGDYQTPEWLCEYYELLERAFAFLWRELFGQAFLYRQSLEMRFWQVLESVYGDKNASTPEFNTHCQAVKNSLPSTLYLFTVQQLPQIELDFLKKLSTYTNVVLFHFNPSAMFWADIVDKNWLLTQRLMRPSAMYLKDYGHGLLSRLGKASRETFAMLAEMSGGDDVGAYQVVWEECFDEGDDEGLSDVADLPLLSYASSSSLSLLGTLKRDILLLEEVGVNALFGQEMADEGLFEVLKNKVIGHTPFCLLPDDDSLVIHNCHSLKRELEVARLLIGRWLNQKNKDGTARKLSDVAIMMPDVETNKALIRSLFGAGVGLDGLSLPANVTGVSDDRVDRLWQSLFGLYALLSGRCYYHEVCEWLLLPDSYQAVGLDEAGAMRACTLLQMAGFVRGFDEHHLAQSLDGQDLDYRRSFAYALDRLVLSVAVFDGLSDVFYPFVWQAGVLPEKTVSVAGVRLEDASIIHALCRVYEMIGSQAGRYEAFDEVGAWLSYLEYEVIDRYFYLQKASDAMKSIFVAMNAMRASLRANQQYLYFVGGKKSTDKRPSMRLPLKFVLDALGLAVKGQKISAEASDMINIGRFGSLRGMSFGLVVMVGMNLSAFPRTTPINRLDLSKAGLPRRGDRVSEDDDNGAFLEALLQARDNCWIFYSGQQMATDGKKLPATPVSELIQFFKTVAWQTPAGEGLGVGDFGAIEAQLIKTHPALPFSPNALGVSDVLVAPMWQAVLEAGRAASAAPAWVTLPDEGVLQAALESLVRYQALPDYPLPSNIALSSLVSAITRPAKAYLSGKAPTLTEAPDEDNEPLVLDGLSTTIALDTMLEYRLSEDFAVQALQGDLDKPSSLSKNTYAKRAYDKLYYDTVLPSGIARKISFWELGAKVDDLVRVFLDNLQVFGIKANAPSPVVNQLVRLSPPPSSLTNKHAHDGQTLSLNLSAALPETSTQVWVNISASRPSPKRAVSAFLSHLVWQIVRPRDDETNHEADDENCLDSLDGCKGNCKAGTSFWQFRSSENIEEAGDQKSKNKTPKEGADETKSLGELMDARACLVFRPMSRTRALGVFWRFLLFSEIVRRMPIALTPESAFAYLSGDLGFEKALGVWLAKPYSKTGYMPDSSSYHESWQKIIGQADRQILLHQALMFAPLLYEPIWQARMMPKSKS